jgi:hypothetical protein
MTVRITSPGLYSDIPNADYHRDPVEGGSLSSSGARALLPPSCPARFRWHQDHGQTSTDHFDFGHAAHQLVLGVGDPIAIIDADDWRTKAAKEARDEARAAGHIPLLADDMLIVEAMADALREHPVANALLAPGTGLPEQTLVWRDATTEVMCRARIDWLPHRTAGRRVIIPDYKTCHSAEPEALRRAMAQFGYHQQADWYLTAARALGLAGADAAFVFICQEKVAPYLVTIFEPDPIALRIAAERNYMARAVYRRCVEAGHWPAYVDDVAQLALPLWVERQEGVA